MMRGSLTGKRSEAGGLMVTTMLLRKVSNLRFVGASKKLTPVGLADVEPICPFGASELADCPLKA